MSHSQSPKEDNSPHESGAIAAWSLVIGGVLGTTIGLFVGRALVLAMIAAGVGWLIGAFIERSKR